MILLMAWMGFLSIVAFTVLIGTLVATMEPIQVAEAGSIPFIGEIDMVGFGFCPQGWAETNSQLLAISQNQALFSLLGTTFGGDGQTTFALPDLRGRDAVHVGSGPGLPNVSWGQKSGTHNYNIATNQLPSHNHGLVAAILQGVPVVGDSVALTGNGLGLSFAKIYSTTAPDTALHTASIAGTTDNTGNGQTLSVTEPFLGIRHCIALVGLFPS